MTGAENEEYKKITAKSIQQPNIKSTTKSLYNNKQTATSTQSTQTKKQPSHPTTEINS
jgi:hypothetical protein